MQRESRHLANIINGRFIAVRQGLQGEHVAPRMRANHYAVCDGVAQELIQQPRFHGIAGQIAVLVKSSYATAAE